MNVQNIVAKLDEKISRLRQARELLASLTEQSNRGTSQRKTTASKHPIGAAPQTISKQQMTAEDRQRIRDAQKARWAARNSESEPTPLAEEVTATEPTAEVLVEA